MNLPPEQTSNLMSQLISKGSDVDSRGLFGLTGVKPK